MRRKSLEIRIARRTSNQRKAKLRRIQGDRLLTILAPSSESEDSDLGDEEIQLRALKSTSFKDGGAVRNAAYEQAPESIDSFITEERILSRVEPDADNSATQRDSMVTTDMEQFSNESSSDKTTVDEINDIDNASYPKLTGCRTEEDTAALEEKARSKAERKEKDKACKQQQKELKAARKSAAVTASDTIRNRPSDLGARKRVPAPPLSGEVLSWPTRWLERLESRP